MTEWAKLPEVRAFDQRAVAALSERSDDCTLAVLGQRLPDSVGAGCRDRSRYTGVDGIVGHLTISVRHVRRLVLERRIPHRKVGSLPPGLTFLRV